MFLLVCETKKKAARFRMLTTTLFILLLLNVNPGAEYRFLVFTSILRKLGRDVYMLLLVVTNDYICLLELMLSHRISRWCHGSPVHRYGLYALQWIVEVNGKPTPDLDAFVDVTKVRLLWLYSRHT